MEVEERNQVWANTRRFYSPDFMFFRWIYRVFSSHNIRNPRWESCEEENPVEDINPGENYHYLLPYIVVAKIMDQNDTLELWNFAYQLYMIITPKPRNTTLGNVYWTHTAADQTSELNNHTSFVICPAMANLTINPNPNIHHHSIPEPELPTSSEIGLDLGFVESSDDSNM